MYKFLTGCLFLCLFNANLPAQVQPAKPANAQTVQADSQAQAAIVKARPDSTQQTQLTFKFFEDNVPWIIAILGFVFGVYQYFLRRKNKKDEVTAELEANAEFEQKQKAGLAQTAVRTYRNLRPE